MIYKYGGSKYCGGNETIHKSKYINVEVDPNGNVIAVWFKYLSLPFQQKNVDRTEVLQPKIEIETIEFSYEYLMNSLEMDYITPREEEKEEEPIF